MNYVNFDTPLLQYDMTTTKETYTIIMNLSIKKYKLMINLLFRLKINQKKNLSSNKKEELIINAHHLITLYKHMFEKSKEKDAIEYIKSHSENRAGFFPKVLKVFLKENKVITLYLIVYKNRKKPYLCG